MFYWADGRRGNTLVSAHPPVSVLSSGQLVGKGGWREEGGGMKEEG